MKLRELSEAGTEQDFILDVEGINYFDDLKQTRNGKVLQRECGVAHTTFLEVTGEDKKTGVKQVKEVTYPNIETKNETTDFSITNVFQGCFARVRTLNEEAGIVEAIINVGAVKEDVGVVPGIRISCGEGGMWLPVAIQQVNQALETEEQEYKKAQARWREALQKREDKALESSEEAMYDLQDRAQKLLFRELHEYKTKHRVKTGLVSSKMVEESHTRTVRRENDAARVLWIGNFREASELTERMNDGKLIVTPVRVHTATISFDNGIFENVIVRIKSDETPVQAMRRKFGGRGETFAEINVSEGDIYLFNPRKCSFKEASLLFFKDGRTKFWALGNATKVFQRATRRFEENLERAQLPKPKIEYVG